MQMESDQAQSYEKNEKYEKYVKQRGSQSESSKPFIKCHYCKVHTCQVVHARDLFVVRDTRARDQTRSVLALEYTFIRVRQEFSLVKTISQTSDRYVMTKESKSQRVKCSHVGIRLLS